MAPTTLVVSPLSSLNKGRYQTGQAAQEKKPRDSLVPGLGNLHLQWRRHGGARGAIDPLKIKMGGSDPLRIHAQPLSTVYM